jgi:high-affinity iron transporter
VRLGWAIVCTAAALVAAAPAHAEVSSTPWQSADRVQRALASAQEEQILGTRADAVRAVGRARAAYRGPLRRALRSEAPASDRALRRAFAVADRAARNGDRRLLAAARGEARAATFGGAYTVTLNAAGRGDADAARSWLLLRDFRTATRFTRPGADGTAAVARLAEGKLSPRETRLAVAKDLLDAYQARLRELLKDGDSAKEKGFATGEAEAAAQAAGYWQILSARYAQDRGAAAADAAAGAFGALRDAAETGDEQAAANARSEIDQDLDGFTAAPFTAEESARRAQQLLRFVALVPVEYGRGVKEGRVTLDFEVQEAIAFAGAADAAFDDLRDQLAKHDRARTDAVGEQLDRLSAVVNDASRKKTGVTSHDDVEAQGKEIEDQLAAVMPKAWQEPTDDSDYDLIALTLDRMEAAVGAGQRRQAEQARLEAYAFFEFGPERRLKSFDPGLATDIEGLIWFGAKGHDGLAELISEGASRREVRATRLALDEQLENARATLGDSASRTTVVTNAAIIVFREGLEAVLILAAITASFVGVRRRLRRPVLVGAGLGLVASLFTWVLAQTILESLSQYGEKLEAVVGLIAIGVLLLITNWFFHRVYWSEWIGRFHRQRRKLMDNEARVGFWSAQAVGLLVLGLTSVYREGFETVLFLQSLELSAGATAVIEGAALGLALTLGVAVLTFVLQRKLPYKKMLIATGGLIGIVLVVMVGQTARTMQGTGWLPIHPIDVEFPASLGLWFGVFPSVETIAAQIGAIVFVLGSYFVATELKVKRPQRKAAAARKEAAPAATNGAAPAATNGTPAPAPAPREPLSR